MRKLAATPEERFWAQVREAGECWEWTGTKLNSGYGAFYNGRRTLGAHRWAYEHMVTDIPQGLYLDHLCRNRLCVNPYHLDPVTPLENARRGDAGKFHREKTKCPQGHPYTEKNTKRHGGRRYCRTCQWFRSRGLDPRAAQQFLLEDDEQAS